MRARKGKIEQSLAQRGRPAVWANEQEAAVLSGVAMDRFRSRVRTWEVRGFPKVNSENGKRSIPAILAFWNISQNHLGVEAVADAHDTGEEDGQENWNAAGQAQRRAS
jgi:hypothetical protein